MANRPIASKRGKLTDRAYAHIRDGILRGDFPVGSVLPEGDIAEALGISRTPVRQALTVLLQEGLLEVGFRRQLMVRGFTTEHRAEILQLREALENVAVRRACEVMEIDEIDQLWLLLVRQRRAANAGSEEAFIDLDEQFHLRLTEAAQLPILYSFLNQLRGFVRVMRLGTVRDPSHLTSVIAEHEKIVRAIERRDQDAAVAALTEHLHKSDYALQEPDDRDGHVQLEKE